MGRRKGNRRNYEFQSERRSQAAMARKRKQLASIKRLNELLARRKAMLQEWALVDERRISDYEKRKKTHTDKRLDRSGTRDGVFKGSAYYLAKDKSAARSARSKTAPPQPKKPWKKTTSSWKSTAQLAALNARRKETRNSWSKDPCVERPDSRKAGKIRQSGKGGGTQPRRWC